MDAGEIATSPSFDWLSSWLPLPFRVAITIVLGVYLWSWNLQYFHQRQIEFANLIRYPPRSSPSQKLYQDSTRELAHLLVAPLVICLLTFWFVTQADPKSILAWEIIPDFYLLYLLALLLIPRGAAKNGRRRFLGILRRVCIGGIAENREDRFADVLVADVLISYSKVLPDSFIVGCMIFKGEHSTNVPERACGGYFIPHLLWSVPSMIRLSQCLIEYFRVVRKGGSKDESRLHLLNALKYSTAFPVIVIAALDRIHPEGRGSRYLFWVFFAILNAMYSFYWDIANDWHLLPISRISERRHSKPVYIALIAGDLILRLTWILSLGGFSEEAYIFIVELLEVLRRGVWVFFRVEKEWAVGASQIQIPLQ